MGSRGGDGFPVPGNCCDFYRERKEEAGGLRAKYRKSPGLVFLYKKPLTNLGYGGIILYYYSLNMNNIHVEAVFMYNKENIKKIVLAYSGGLDTSIIIPWLKENYNNP